jgi:magnesium transporter
MIANAFARACADHAPIRAVPLDEVRGLSLEQHNFVWVDIQAPDPDDLAQVKRTFGFHPLALEDVSRQHQRPKVDEYPGYYFVVLYAVRPDGQAGPLRTSELQFFWGKNYLVTVHVEPWPEIVDLARRLERGELSPVNGATGREVGVTDLVYRLVDATVDGYFPAVDSIAERSEDIEERMFSAASGPQTLQEIFSLKKDLVHLRKVTAPSRDVLNVLLRRDLELCGWEYVPYFQDVYDHTVRVIDSLDTYQDLLSSAVDIYLSLVSNNVNQAVKTMTAITAILMVLALIAGIYGMNFQDMPELRWPFGYAWALGLMATSAVGLWLLFRRIRWL